MVFDSQDLGLMKTEVLPRLLLEGSRKEDRASLSTAANMQLGHNSAASLGHPWEVTQT